MVVDHAERVPLAVPGPCKGHAGRRPEGPAIGKESDSKKGFLKPELGRSANWDATDINQNRQRPGGLVRQPRFWSENR